LTVSGRIDEHDLNDANEPPHVVAHGAFRPLFFSAATLLRAAPGAVVDGVQLPAWFIRDGKRQPLATGTELKSNDEVATGLNSRLLLRLGDGSMVKLGENGQLQLSELVQRPRQNFLGATLKVLEGTFRFTTEAVQRTRARRDITVQFPSRSLRCGKSL